MSWNELQRKAEAYLGPGAFVWMSDRKDKKYYVIHPETEKKIHFGDKRSESFIEHKDEERRRRYLARATKIKGDWKNDKYSPNNLSINILW